MHAFDPGDLQRLMQGAGFTDTRVQGEELSANWFGWFNRALEADGVPSDIPNVLAPIRIPRLPRLPVVRPRHLLQARSPASIFYNLMIAARGRVIDVERARAETPGVETSRTSTTPARRCRRAGPRGGRRAPAPEAAIGGYEAAAQRADRVEHTYDAIATLIGARPRRDRASSRTPRARGTWRSTRCASGPATASSRRRPSTRATTSRCSRWPTARARRSSGPGRRGRQVDVARSRRCSTSG